MFSVRYFTLTHQWSSQKQIFLFHYTDSAAWHCKGTVAILKVRIKQTLRSEWAKDIRFALFSWIGWILWRMLLAVHFYKFSPLERKKLPKHNEENFSTEWWLQNLKVYFPSIRIFCPHVGPELHSRIKVIYRSTATQQQVVIWRNC